MILTRSQKSELKNLEYDLDNGEEYVLVVYNKYHVKFFRINSIEKLSNVCWKIYKERLDLGWYDETKPDIQIGDGLSCYFFLLNRNNEGYEYEEFYLRKFEE